MTEDNVQYLREASFRGVKFFVRGGDTSFGRRAVLNEYPMRDKPFVEDLGRKARTFSLQGLVVGQNFLDDLAKLQQALETKGPGELIHPWLGRQIVSVTDSITVSFPESRWVAEFTITFTESGELDYPTQTADTRANCVTSARKLQEASLEDFAEHFNLTSAQDFIQLAVAEKIKGFLQDPLMQLSGAIVKADKAANIANTIVTLVASPPKVLGEQLLDAVGLGDIERKAGSWRSVVAKAKLIGESSRLNPPHRTGLIRGSIEEKEEEANQAFSKLIRHAQISNAVLATTKLGTADDKVEGAASKNLSYDEVISLRDGLLETIEKELFDPEISDSVFQALSDCQSSVYADLSERAEDSAKLFEYTPGATMPAVVLAYEIYEDANRDLEIVARNHIARGGFVPTVPLKLLSE